MSKKRGQGLVVAAATRSVSDGVSVATLFWQWQNADFLILLSTFAIGVTRCFKIQLHKDVLAPKLVVVDVLFHLHVDVAVLHPTPWNLDCQDVI